MLVSEDSKLASDEVHESDYRTYSGPELQWSRALAKNSSGETTPRSLRRHPQS